MLVLSRREGETIQIEDISIRITQIKGRRVTIGIDAPKSKRIIRGELGEGLPPTAIMGIPNGESLELPDTIPTTYGA